MKFLRLITLLLAWMSAANAALPSQVKIGVLLKGKSDFWAAVAKGAATAGAKLGAEVIIKSPMSETDIAVQIRLLDSLAAQGIQALVIAPCNKDSLAGPVAALAATGVKIVVIDSQLAGAGGTVFVGTDQRAAGEAAGSLLAGLVADGDEVAFLKHSQGDGATGERESGAMAKLMAAHPRVIVHGEFYASSEPDKESDRAHFLLNTYPNTKAIFSSGTPGTMAMLRVLSAAGSGPRAKLVGCGFNLNPDVVAALQNATLAGWVAQLPEDVGGKGVEAAWALLSGRAVPAFVPINFLVVTKANLSDPRIQGLLAL